MITITTSQLTADKWSAKTDWNGREYSAASTGGASHALARELVSAGALDQPWKTSTMSGPSLHWLAAYRVMEDDYGCRLGRWQPHPKGTYSEMFLGAVAKVHADIDTKRAQKPVRRRGKTGMELPRRRVGGGKRKNDLSVRVSGRAFAVRISHQWKG